MINHGIDYSTVSASLLLILQNCRHCKYVIVWVIAPVLITMVFLYSLCNAFKPITMETRVFFGGEEPFSLRLGRYIAAVLYHNDVVSVSHRGG